MPTFYLEPKDDDLSAPEWDTTSVKEGVWVTADDENHARMIMQLATPAMIDQGQGHKVVFSPWLNPELTTCVPENPPEPLPNDKIRTTSGKLIDI
jgi:hypothetical protein